jgi:hypothetical protein
VEALAWMRAGTVEGRREEDRRGGSPSTDEGWPVEAGAEQGLCGGGLGVEDGRRAWTIAARRSGCGKVLVGRMTRGQWGSSGAGRTEFDLGHNPFQRGREAPIYKIPMVTGNIEACDQ